MNNANEISQEEWERLERYAANRMHPDERSAFDRELVASPRLQEGLQEVQWLAMGIGEAVLHQKLQTFHQALPVPEEEPRIHRRTISLKTWLAAASILLLACLGGWLLLGKQSGGEKLFAAYFKPDPGLMTTMGATDNYAFERAMIDYKRGDYKAAIQTWDSLQKAQPANDTLSYFLGVAHLADDNAGAAVGYLQKVVASSGFFREDAFWYLGLSLLAEGKKEEASINIESSNHPDKESLLTALRNEVNSR